MRENEVVLVGLTGKLGSTVGSRIGGGFELVAGVVSPECSRKNVDINGRQIPLLTELPVEEAEGRIVIDCSTPGGTEVAIRASAGAKSPIVIATTGHSEEQLREIRDAADKIPVVMDSNFSLGMAVIRRIIEHSLPFPEVFELSIVERHNSSKKDSPSGTAKDLAGRISSRYGGLSVKTWPGPRKEREIEVVAVRAGRSGGSEHRLLAEGPNEEIELRHTTTGSMAYVDGIMRALEWVSMHRNKTGLYSLSDLLTV